MYNRLVALCRHRNKKLRYAAFPALQATLLQVSRELVSANRKHESNKETFKVNTFAPHQSLYYISSGLHLPFFCITRAQFFIKKFFELLESPSGGVTEISIGIIGFGQFAGPIQMMLGTYELKKLLNKLFVLSEKYISR